MKNKPLQQILVVDDDQSFHLICAYHLSEDEYTIISAMSGQDALEILKDTDFDLAIIDYQMPHMDGLELLKLIRAEYKFKTLPVIIATSANDDDLLPQFLNAGASDFLRKPFRGAELQARVRNHIQTRKLVQSELALAMGGTAAHHINQRIAVISGYLSVIMEMDLPPEVITYLNTCYENTSSISEIVTQLTNLTEIRFCPYVGREPDRF